METRQDRGSIPRASTDNVLSKLALFYCPAQVVLLWQHKKKS